MYRSRNVARLAGAMGLPVVLAAWGLGSLLLTGETTVSTWAFALGFTLPLSGLLLALVSERPVPGVEPAYAVGLLCAFGVTTALYLTLVTVAPGTLVVLGALGALELVVVAALAACCGGLLAFVDVRYVDRPRSVALLEAKYLDDPDESA
jgi:hypothetical protein